MCWQVRMKTTVPTGGDRVGVKFSLLSLQVQWAAHAQPWPGHDVGIDLCRAYINVAEQIPERADIYARLQQMGRERMPQHVRCHALVQPRRPRRHPNRLLERRIQHMMPAAQ